VPDAGGEYFRRPALDTMKKFLLCMGFLSVLFMGLAGCFQEESTDPSWNNVRERGSLIVGVSEGNLPLTFRNSSKKVVGFDVEAGTEVCRRLNLTVQLLAIDPSEVTKNLDEGTIDCYWSGLPASSRETEDPYATTPPYLHNDDVFLLPLDSPIRNIANLTNKRLGVMSGSSGEEALRQASQLHASLNLVVNYETIEEAFTALNSGAVDGMVMGETIARYFMNLNPDRYRILEGEGEEKKSQEPLNTQECVVAFRLTDTALRRKIEAALQSMHKDGKMAEISERWFGSNISIDSVQE